LQAASDYASGVTGFAFLAIGFVVQALPSFGVQATQCAQAAEIAAAAGLVGGVVVAWTTYEALRALFFRGEKAYTERSYRPYKLKLRFKPGFEQSGRWRVPRLWKKEPEAGE
jgi:hypothetical protein